MKKDSKAMDILKKLQKIGYVLFNLAYVGAFIAYTVYQFYMKNQAVTWLPYVLIAITLVYFISFMVVIFKKDDDDAEVKQNVKTYKSSLKIFKKVLKFANLVMAAVMVANTVVYDQNIFSFVLAVVNVVVSLIQIIKSIVKMIKKEKKAKIKAAKKGLRKDMVEDIKGMINDEPQQQLETVECQELAVEGYEENDQLVEEEEPEEPQSKKEIIQKKVMNIAGNADKIAKRVVQYNNDKKEIGKKKKK